MHIEFLVEEASAQVVLENILPKILGEGVSFDIHAYQGKPNLLSKLPSRLKGYKQWLPEDWRIVVIIDEDREDCKVLKQKLDKMAADAGLVTKTVAGSEQSFQVLNRLAIEELEAWFFGYLGAIAAAYPRMEELAEKAKYRNPDGITGGTWEALERELQKKGYHAGGLEKYRAAQEISQHMNPERNRSKSFQLFRDSLSKMIT